MVQTIAWVILSCLFVCICIAWLVERYRRKLWEDEAWDTFDCFVEAATEVNKLRRKLQKG